MGKKNRKKSGKTPLKTIHTSPKAFADAMAAVNAVKNFICILFNESV